MDTGSLPMPPPFFGLSSFCKLLSIFDKTYKRVDFLRQVAKTMQVGQADLIIGISRQSSHRFKLGYECTSAIPRHRTSVKRTNAETEHQADGHCHWISLEFSESPVHCWSMRSGEALLCSCMMDPLQLRLRSSSEAKNRFDISSSIVLPQPIFGDINAVGFEHDLFSSIDSPSKANEKPHTESSQIECLCVMEGYRCSIQCHDDERDACSNIDNYPSLKCVKGCAGKGECFGCSNRLIQEMYEKRGEDCFFVSSNDLIKIDPWHFSFRKPGEEEATYFEFVLGDPDSVAIFQRSGIRVPRYIAGEAEAPATMDEIEAILASCTFDGTKLYEYLRDWWNKTMTETACQQLEKSLEALVFACLLYQHLIEATIDIGVINTPLYEMRWGSHKSNTTLARAFSCIAMFESGEFNLDPDQLQGVLALSTGDSIFVASALLTDPTTDTSCRPIQRVFGNLGRPEMVLLIPPSESRLEPFDHHSWRLVNHDLFDGRLRDAFALTSLHLSFTDFELAVDVGQRGLRDNRVVLVESLVSLNHRGKHMGDLDILSLFNSDYLVATQRSCEEHSKEPMTSTEENPRSLQLVSIENWEEFLDFPENPAIFLVTGNWQARIAGAAASIQKGKRTVILPSNPCLICISKWCESGQFDVLIA